MTEPMSAEDRAYMHSQTGAGVSRSSWWDSKTDAAKMRVLVGWTMVFTGIVAAAVVTNMVVGFVAVIQATSSTY